MDYEKIFPKQFRFFHFGTVTPEKKDLTKDEIPFIVSFQINGDERGICTVAFDTMPDESEKSMAIEMSNILVSKFINSLSEVCDGFIAISTPQVLSKSNSSHRHLIATVRNILNSNDPATQCYEYSGVKANMVLRLSYLKSIVGES